MSPFESRGDFEEALSNLAAENGMAVEDVLTVLSRRDRGIRRYQRVVELEQRRLRRSNPEVDRLLVAYYGYAPQNLAVRREQSAGEREQRSSFSADDLNQQAVDERAQRRRETLRAAIGLT
jgi:hypothetical protein